MISEDFFTITSGFFKNADDAFDQAVKAGLLKADTDDGDGTIIGKTKCVVIEAPEGKDPLVFAKERSAQHGNDFWNFYDGPAACVEIKGSWLKNNGPGKKKNPKGFKTFVFFGCGYLKG